MSTLVVRIYLFCLFLLGSSSLLSAQSLTNTADLLGTVHDQTDAILPGADVTAVNIATGLERVTLSDDEGRYRIPLLPPGQYELTVELSGFNTTVIRGITLTVGQVAELDVTLQVSAEGTEVIVESDADIIERQKTVQASTLSEAQIDNLPINGRNYLQFSLLTPGASGDSPLITFSAPQVPSSGLSFTGQDPRSNYVTIDGVDNMDATSGGVRSTLSQDSIQEFQISRNAFSAEFGRARGGLINIVSKSGTNQFHGNAFFFFRNNALDARNTFAKLDDPPFSRREFGGTLGGPIAEDRTFFFASYEHLTREESNFVTFLDDPSIFEPTGSQLQLFDFLGSTGILPLQLMSAAFIHPQFGVLRTLETNFPATIARFENESGIFPFDAELDTFSFKLDHQVSAANRLFGRFNFTDSSDEGVEYGALQAVSNGLSIAAKDFSFVLSNTHVFSPLTLNDLKFQFGGRDFTAETNDPTGPELILSGVAEFGREFFNPTAYEQKLFQITDTATFVRGNHTLKVGVDSNQVDIGGYAKVFLGGQFSFGEAIPLGMIMDSLLGSGTAQGLIRQLLTPESAGGLGRPDLAGNVLQPITSLQSFNFGLPITFFKGFGDPNVEVDYYQLGMFIQDSWQIAPNFTVNLGLRYDADWRPETQSVASGPPFEFKYGAVNDHNNVSPRIGFAWDPFGEASTVIRGGYGIFYQNYLQGIAFVSKVLSGQISQVFLPITGLPGLEATSADVYKQYLVTGRIDEEALGNLGIVPGATPSVILPGAPDFTTPYSQHASFGIEHELLRDYSISLDYLLNKGSSLIRSRDINVRQIGDNEFALPGLDPRFVQINMIESSGSSIYHGFTAALKKRFSQSFSFMASYTIGKAIDDTTDFISQLQPNNQTDLKSERGLSAFDQRQRFVFSGVWMSPYRLHTAKGFGKKLLADWTFSPIITIASGRPFNLFLGYDLNGDTHEETDRPVLSDGTIVARNSATGPSYVATDLRLSRKFYFSESVNFEFLFEAFNLFNNVNYTGVNNIVGNQQLTTGNVVGSANIPSNQFLGFTSAAAPRQIQFGFRFTF
ncbi:MAG: TonB-dependent receptor [Acidobacteriota bacterium]|nr:MAG: TonB-dependent receptor [Acidobacteriota bacterium]